MAGKKGNKNHANKTSYPNQKRNDVPPKVIIRKFFEMYENAKIDTNILCFQDACTSIGWRPSKIEYWIKKIPTLKVLKRDIQDLIVSRVNKNALHNEFNPTSSIWRMKQLGELDKQHIEQETTIKTGLNIEVQDKNTAKELNSLKSELENEDN